MPARSSTRWSDPDTRARRADAAAPALSGRARRRWPTWARRLAAGGATRGASRWTAARPRDWPAAAGAARRCSAASPGRAGAPGSHAVLVEPRVRRRAAPRLLRRRRGGAPPGRRSRAEWLARSPPGEGWRSSGASRGARRGRRPLAPDALDEVGDRGGPPARPARRGRHARARGRLEATDAALDRHRARGGRARPRTHRSRSPRRVRAAAASR